MSTVIGKIMIQHGVLGRPHFFVRTCPVGDFRRTHGGFSMAMFERVTFLIHPLLADQELGNAGPFQHFCGFLWLFVANHPQMFSTLFWG